jgi:hypothetical protein
MSRHLRVFDENGQPSAKWDRVDALLSHLLHHKRELNERTDRIGSFIHLAKWEQLINGVLCVMLPGQELLNTSDTTRICMSALDKCAKSNESDPIKARRIFARFCDDEIDTILGKGERAFTVHTSLSLPNKAAIGDLSYRGAVLRCTSHDAPQPTLPPILDEAVYVDLVEMWRQCRYRRVCVSVSALTPDDAVHRGLRVVNLVRALVSLRRGMGTESVQLVGRRDAPLALVHLGPLHLVAEGGGQEFINDAWDEELYTQDWKTPAEDKTWGDTEAEVRRLLERLADLPYRPEMENLLCRYISALDETRWSVVLLQLWSILEKITATIGHNQKSLATRASRVFPNRHLARDVIEAVRCTRNRVVHAGHAKPLNERWASELKPIIETHLHHMLFNTFDVESMDEYAEVLEMPRASTALCREIALRRAMMKFQDGQK